MTGRLFIAVLVFVSTALSAQTGVQQSLSYDFTALLANPALLQDHGVSIRFGAAQLSAYGPYQVTDLGSVERYRLVLDGSRTGSLAVRGPIGVSNSVETIGVNVRAGDTQIGVYHALRTEAFGVVPSGIAPLLVGGIETVDARELSVWPRLRLMAFHELGIHKAGRIGRRWVLGARVKVLAGSAIADLADGRLTLSRDEDRDIVLYDGNASLRSAGLDVDLSAGRLDDDLDPWRPISGFGLAADLGVVYRPSNKMEWALSASDLGALRWTRDARTHSFDGSGSYSGPRGRGDTERLDISSDTLLLGLANQLSTTTDIAQVTTVLYPSARLHVRRRIGRATSVDAVAVTHVTNSEVRTAGGVGISQSVDDLLQVGATLSRLNDDFQLGARVSLTLAGIRLYASADNLGLLVNPRDQRSVYVRAGFSLNLRPVAHTGSRLGWFDDEPSTGRTTPDNYL